MSNEQSTVVGFGILLEERHLKHLDGDKYWELLEALFADHENVEVFMNQTGSENRLFLSAPGHYIKTDRYDDDFIKKVPNIMGSTRAVADKLRAAASKFYPHELSTGTYYMVNYN